MKSQRAEGAKTVQGRGGTTVERVLTTQEFSEGEDIAFQVSPLLAPRIVLLIRLSVSVVLIASLY